MKAQDFYDLTKRTRAAQKLYFRTRLNGDLIAAKQLEAQLDKALQADGLEPDVPAIERLGEEQYKEYLRLVNENQLELRLDLSGSQRPTDGKGEQSI